MHTLNWNKKPLEMLKTRSITAMDLRYLKVKEDISLTKNYSITISIQKINLIHKFIPTIKQILWSHELKCRGHF